MMWHRLRVALLCMLIACGAVAQVEPSRRGQNAIAQVDLERSRILAEGRPKDGPRPLEIELGLTRPVPYRVFLLDAPTRLVVDFREVDFSQTSAQKLTGAENVPAVRWGRFRPGWSRMVIELPGPVSLDRVELRTSAEADGIAALNIALDPVAERDFRPEPNAMSALWDLPQPAIKPPPEGVRPPLRIALDPGHGGSDPGAQVDGVQEARLVLSFAGELAVALRRAGFEVVLTRDRDVYVPLEQRMTAARHGAADLFISLHADALPAGEAAGATIYTWKSQSNDRAGWQLSMLHNRDDLVSGVDLEGQDDQIAQVLMDLARRDTAPRSENFAKFLASEMARANVGLHKRPVKGAAFSVLKSPDIPSVLLELGFLTDPGDRANLIDPAWRARLIAAVTRAVSGWSDDDTLRGDMLRH